MSETVIQVENLSKQYRLGIVGTGTILHDLNRWWHLLRGQSDPYLEIGDRNDRTSKGVSDYVWALKDINFEIKKGEVIGIVGRNGAGKSTLLKILSRTTGPTTGTIKVKGRISSLLEVGTGFHPELSGRDNIYLNGAILGMHKREIHKKFDEIVDFSGVERYLDTPVKRYSSGMYVRLAFAVAAHLEPDILVVDEVLAVGDTEFQNKCLGKMNSAAGDGRTIIFVSHNLQALKQLCPKSILLSQGEIEYIGNSNSVLQKYLKANNNIEGSCWEINEENAFQQKGTDYFKLTRFYLTDKNGCLINKPISSNCEFIYVVFEGIVERPESRLSVGFVLRDEFNNMLISSKHTDIHQEEKFSLANGKNIFRVQLNVDILNEGIYYLDYNSGLWGIRMLNSGEENRISIQFKIEGLRGDSLYYNKRRDVILSPYLKWQLLK